MGQGNNGLSRGDANRNARLAALRAVLPTDHAILGIDLAQSRQAEPVGRTCAPCRPGTVAATVAATVLAVAVG